ncbi:MATE family efflux transporter [Halorarius litoreus]|uniref:MATE family efflux transporter n=1 Tax=Halorarius litoreus TaxID=2962676 RepID=UPI0020CF2411|nr:MATE family efflux transporter [Halorarius litoreus]
MDRRGGPEARHRRRVRRQWCHPVRRRPPHPGHHEHPRLGFGLASSSLVGQSLGAGDEGDAEAYGTDVIRHAVGVYVGPAILVGVFAERIVVTFVGSATAPAVPIAITLVYAACIAVVVQGVSGAAAAPLDARGDTRWPFLAQAAGMVGYSIPIVYLGPTPLGTVPRLRHRDREPRGGQLALNGRMNTRVQSTKRRAWSYRRIFAIVTGSSAWFSPPALQSSHSSRSGEAGECAACWPDSVPSRSGTPL